MNVRRLMGEAKGLGSDLALAVVDGITHAANRIGTCAKTAFIALPASCLVAYAIFSGHALSVQAEMAVILRPAFLEQLFVVNLCCLLALDAALRPVPRVSVQRIEPWSRRYASPHEDHKYPSAR